MSYRCAKPQTHFVAARFRVVLPAGCQRSQGLPGANLAQVLFELFPRVSTLREVRRVKFIAVFGFLVCWLVASNHCRLETLPGLSFLACADLGDCNPTSDPDCDTDGCAAIEGAIYKTEDGQTQLPLPSVVVEPLVLIQPPRPVSAAQEVVLILVPQELPKGWQFSYRAAAPPRAPSLIS